MSTSAFSSQGSQLEVLISSTYTPVPAIVGINVPKVDPVFDDITNLDSAGGFGERIIVGKAFFTETFEMIWNPSNYVHRFLEDASFDQSIQSFQILVSAGGATYQFSAYVGFQGKLAIKKAGRASMILNGTGALTRVA